MALESRTASSLSVKGGRKPNGPGGSGLSHAILTIAIKRSFLVGYVKAWNPGAYFFDSVQLPHHLDPLLCRPRRETFRSTHTNANEKTFVGRSITLSSIKTQPKTQPFIMYLSLPFPLVAILGLCFVGSSS